MLGQELKDEMIKDCIRESRQDDLYEKHMYEDEEFAISQFEIEIIKLSDKLREISDKLEYYGHHYSPKDLVDIY